MIIEKIRISETASLTAMLTNPENTENNRPAVLICPGGGYSFVSPREADPIALQFAGIGYHTFILNYTVPPKEKYGALKEASEAMCLIRKNAQKWSVNPDKIAICGFSAGAHLACTLGTKWHMEFLAAQGQNKPNAMILAYPVISSDNTIWHQGSFKNLMGDGADYSEMSLEKWVSSNTPPTFLWHTVEDKTVPVENSLRFAAALQENNISYEMHIYPKGGHGMALASDDPHVNSWVKLCLEWITLQFGDSTFK